MKEKRLKIYSCLLLIIGAIMIVSGISSSQHRDVFEKGIRICLECIGIG